MVEEARSELVTEHLFQPKDGILDQAAPVITRLPLP
jgi:hypothetical protein